MNTLRLNPDVDQFDFLVKIESDILVEMGWDFDMTEEEAKEYCAEIHITQGTGSMYTTVELNTWEDVKSGISNGSAEETGDDKETIKDLIEYFEKYPQTLTQVDDRSVDSDHSYVPTFIPA